MPRIEPSQISRSRLTASDLIANGDNEIRTDDYLRRDNDFDVLVAAINEIESSSTLAELSTAPATYDQAYVQSMADQINAIRQALVDAGIVSDS